MSNRYLDQHQLGSHHHHRFHSAPDVPFSWEMSPGVSKQDEQSSSRRHGREQPRLYLQSSDHHHNGSSGTCFDNQDLSPHYLVHENARRAIKKPPLRPPPSLVNSSPRVWSSHSEQLATRGTPKTATKFGGRNKSGGADVDPFLAAYMKCTTPQKAAPKRKSSGFSFSCKSSVSSGIRDDALVRIPHPSKV